jgi:hypothetical protein
MSIRDNTHPNETAFPKGMSGPALRALKNAGIRSLSEASRWREADLGELHGMGPKGIRILKAALKLQGRKLRA